MAIIYRVQGKYEEALEMYTKSLAIRTRIYGDSHLDVAKSDGNLGNVLADMGKPEEALVHLQRGVEIKLKLLGSEDPLVPASYQNLAGVY
jgi:tetratricopeptide (TPR) repeat protein